MALHWEAASVWATALCLQEGAEGGSRPVGFDQMAEVHLEKRLQIWAGGIRIEQSHRACKDAKPDTSGQPAEQSHVPLLWHCLEEPGQPR